MVVSRLRAGVGRFIWVLNHPALKGTPPRRGIRCMRSQDNSLLAQSSCADIQQRFEGGVSVQLINISFKQLLFLAQIYR